MDDVSFLQKHAVPETFLFVADSSTRNTGAFPTPSEYELEFALPFRNVVGLDLVDVAIARTEYLIDSGSNVLEYALGTPTSASSVSSWYDYNSKERVRRVVVPPGDYNLPQLIEALGAAMAAPKKWDAPTNRWVDIAVVTENTLTASELTTPSEISNKIRLRCAEAFTVFGDTSTMRTVIGLGNRVNTVDTILNVAGVMCDPSTGDKRFTPAPGWLAASPSTGGAAFCSFEEIDEDTVATVLSGSLPVDSSYAVTSTYRVRQYFTPDVTGPPRSVSVFASGSGTLSVKINNAATGTEIATGTVAVTTTETNTHEPFTVTFSTTTKLLAGTSYRVEFWSDGSVGVFHEVTNLSIDTSKVFAKLFTSGGSETVTGWAADDIVCCDVGIAVAGNTIVSPGLVNLSGARYLSVRCLEIEQHMYRDRAYERYHAGLGIVKMSGYGFREQRFDFVSFPHRTFHAIGKLSKLTIRLERPDGSLWNSHGVDHTLTLVVRYLSIPPVADASNTLLNPTYTPDLRQYLTREKWRREEEDSYRAPR
jgi:hypothetical protein